MATATYRHKKRSENTGEEACPSDKLKGPEAIYMKIWGMSNVMEQKTKIYVEGMGRKDETNGCLKKNINRVMMTGVMTRGKKC